jgi:hypothetical protein
MAQYQIAGFRAAKEDAERRNGSKKSTPNRGIRVGDQGLCSLFKVKHKIYPSDIEETVIRRFLGPLIIG